MKLLIITQKVDQNDSILGFFHRWIIEFSKHFEIVTVICLEKGAYDFPSNVKVLSLGKEEKVSKSQYINRFYSYIWSKRKDYDAVFVHMNPVYIVLGGFIWKLLGKNIYLWYVHVSVDIKLRISALFVDTIFTATKESIKLNNKRVKIIGHGIDTERYSTIIRPTRVSEDPIRIVHVGRITRIKNCDIIIEAADVLKKTWNKKFEIIFIGSPVTVIDHEYKKILEDRIKQLGLSDIVHFIGSVPNKDIDKHYIQADASINLAQTGGVDKAVLESFASGVPAFFSNETFLSICEPYGNIFHVVYKDSSMLAEKIKIYFAMNNTGLIETELRTRIIDQFSVSSLISRISLYIHDTSR